MKQITFYKLSGSGNDFIIIDNRDRVVNERNLKDFIAGVCRRRVSVGADGFILIEKSDTVDFKWRFFNSDGSIASMCGNGAMCAARFAYLNRIAGSSMSFETEAGIISARVTNSLVKIKMPDPVDLMLDYTIELKNGPLLLSSVNVGVPHVIVATGSIDNIEIVKLGREIRFHERYAPAGTNVNFISPPDDNTIAIRTYERGVEDETLACGTGSVAGAIVAAYKSRIESPINVTTRGGGSLRVYYKEGKERFSALASTKNRFYDIHLEGDTRIIYEARLWEDAWR